MRKTHLDYIQNRYEQQVAQRSMARPATEVPTRPTSPRELKIQQIESLMHHIAEASASARAAAAERQPEPREELPVPPSLTTECNNTSSSPDNPQRTIERDQSPFGNFYVVHSRNTPRTDRGGSDNSQALN